MPTVTLATLRSRVRERADMVNSSFVTDAANSVDYFIDAASQELYDLLCQKYGEDYFATSATFVTVAGTETVALPTDFYKLLGVDLSISGYWQELGRFNWAERNALRNSVAGGTFGDYGYRLEGSNIRILPAPASVLNGKFWYLPVYTVPTATLQTINGWDEFVVMTAAIGCLLKEESDVTDLRIERDRMLARIEAAAERRDAGSPERISDVRGWD